MCRRVITIVLSIFFLTVMQHVNAAAECMCIAPSKKNREQIIPGVKAAEDVKEEHAACAQVIDVAEHHEQGKRPTMEDASIVDKEKQVFAVFDGHGGADFAHFARDNFMQALAETNNLGVAFKRLERRGQEQKVVAGATAVAVRVLPSSRQIQVASTGDSRAILIRDGRVVALTRDHKIEDPIELKRIHDLGNEVYISIIEKEADGQSRRIHKPYTPELHAQYPKGVLRLGPLNMARSMGDYKVKSFLKKKHGASALIAKPDVSYWPYQEGDVVVLACDGLWDVISNDNVSGFIARQKEVQKPGKSIAQQSAQGLVKNALTMGSDDNISVIVVDFGMCKPVLDK